MNSNRLALSICSLLCLAATAVQAEGPVAKQLSGAPEEFAAMRVPDPVDSAIYSKSALIPIQMDVDASGQARWRGELPVENGRTRFAVFSGGANWQVNLLTPDSKRQQTLALTETARAASFGIEEARVPGNYYVLENIQSGNYSIDLAGDSFARRGYLLIEGDPATQLVSFPTHRRLWVGERITINATLSSSSQPNSVLLGRGAIQSAELRVTSPDGRIDTRPMFDDGQHDDGAAADGVFAGDFRASSSGDYLAQTVVHATDGRGQRIVRTAEHVVPIVQNTLSLDGAASVNGKALGGTRLSLDVKVDGAAGDHYRAYAEVWGTGKNGAAIPVAWVAGMVSPNSGTIGMGLDERWIARSGAGAPFELRNLRIEDPDNFITLASADRLGLNLSAARLHNVASESIAIDDDMRMGPHPAAALVSKGVGTHVLLVHGYCSGGVWPAAQFGNSASFLDTNQNRSHDQFARLLQSFGNTWNSYGTVAHSQGGAAALHLYTYYWSGLDNATGSRLMQSVGTPYKGTNLAGILAALGSWFGVGCGTNNDLSYSGASAWLAGIPTWARAKVNYYTTSFKSTNWWTNDYCNFATDLVLSDPEDGTTEQVNGQLTGATNRGHTTGQCHTSGMRDPAQYLDSSRNATMNANAAH
ncbi:MAG: choice-of-anchor X domain-containing protein [Tahibacter sp.]